MIEKKLSNDKNIECIYKEIIKPTIKEISEILNINEKLLISKLKLLSTHIILLEGKITKKDIDGIIEDIIKNENILGEKIFNLLINKYKECINKNYNNENLKYFISKLEEYLKNKNSEEFTDDFFCLDNEDNKIVNNLSTKNENENIFEHLDKEEIDNLIDIFDEYHGKLLDENGTIEDYINIIENILRVFFYLPTFKTFEIALTNLKNALIKYKESNNENNKELILRLTSAMIGDIYNWFEHVIVKQDVDNPHYLDDSLLASIIQIKELLE